MAADDWVMVRIKRGTHAELRRVELSLRTAEEAGLVELSKDDRDRVSIDQVIRRLIAFRDRHADRRRKSAARRRGMGPSMKRKRQTSAETVAGTPPGADGGTVGMLPKPEPEAAGLPDNRGHSGGNGCGATVGL